MTDKRISELTNITGANLADTDEFVVVDTSASETKAVTWAELKNGLDTSTGFVRITGDTMTGDLGTTNIDLAAIAESKAVTAVDVFVYDTSKDSDGGAWRKRCQHTSWYNETLNTATRGSRREFPAVAVIVAENDNVTIYDGDDPALPMWMVFNRTNNSIWRYADHNATSISAVNGIVAVGKYNAANYGGVALIRFAADNIQGHSNGRGDKAQGVYKGVISERNDSLGWDTATLDLLVDARINDVAMTVLPDAPIDPATGLPVPTIAVATAGGVSVITDSGAVYDITGDPVSDVSINSDGRLFIGEQHLVAFGSLPIQDGTGGTWRDGYYSDGAYSPTLATLETTNTNGVIVGSAIASSKGLVSLQEDQNTPSEGMVAYTTSTYNTGWMNGDIKGCWLSDTDDTDLVGSGELVTNGTFDTDITGWSVYNPTYGSISSVSGRLRLSQTLGGQGAIAEQAITTVAGQTYVISVDFVTDAVTGNSFIRAGAASGGLELLNKNIGSTTGTKVLTFKATGTTTYVSVSNSSTSLTGEYSEWDNISVKLADADRSVNNNGLIVNGTVTRTAIATGADLVAYSGFSASNYLEAPYNSDLDFGTGDFCVMGWITYNSSALNNYIIDRQDGANSTTDRWNFGISSSGFFNRCDNVSVSVPYTFTNAQRYFVCGVRSSGTLYAYVNGSLVGTATQGGDQTDASGSYPLTVGVIGSLTGSESPTNLALLRISATAPTAEQIAKIYEDEKVLFQEGAQATLYGASDAVTALAHDSDTGLLHVGTSAGRSVFQGLRRVSNTTTAVGTAISASNNLIVEE